MILERINFPAHDWLLCGVVNFFYMTVGQQRGITTFPCFIYELDSRARDQGWSKNHWAVRKTKILQTTLYIKIGLLKYFSKHCLRDDMCSKNSTQKFPHSSEDKLREGVFVGPNIRQILFDSNFNSRMFTKQKDAWISFTEVTAKFLGK